jgi:hypothetical protein
MFEFVDVIIMKWLIYFLSFRLSASSEENELLKSSFEFCYSSTNKHLSICPELGTFNNWQIWEKEIKDNNFI